MNPDSETELKRASDGSGHVPPRTGPLQFYFETRDSFLRQGPGTTPPTGIHTVLTSALDKCLSELAISAPELTVVAVGGYGRSELCLYSDIDLLLLHEGPVPEESVRSLLYPLWDSGLKVGHATRTVKATLNFAREDLSTLCTILSARLVAGPPERLHELNRGLGRVLNGTRPNLIEQLAAQERAIWEREPFAVQDLDIKNGRGGLRSLHRLDWDRRRSEFLGEDPAVPLEASEIPARKLLLSVRQALHAVQNRAADRYLIDLRTSVAEWLEKEPASLATEVYRAARFIDGLAAVRWGRVRPSGVDPIAHAGLAIVRSVRSRWTRGQHAATPLAFARSAVASDAGGRLSKWERDFAARSGPPEWTAGDRSALVALLAAGQPGWESLLGLWESGWLSRALPELAHMQGLAQVSPIHRHPADAHLGATVASAVSLADRGSGWVGDLAEEMGSLDEVLLAAFLHDIGKGLGGDHAEVGAGVAASLLERTGFGAATVSVVGRAVRHHLLLPAIAFRRDIDDPQVVNEVAKTIGDQDLLRVLTLVSVADASATGPDMWNPWKESLLRALVQKASSLLDGTMSDLPAELEASVASLVPELDRRQIADHIGAMPAGYVTRFGPDLVAQHLRLINPPIGHDEIRAALIPGAPVSTLVTAARDRVGLLSTIAGVFAVHNLGVLEARVVTRNDDIALDTFRVSDTLGSDMIGPGRWAAVRESLDGAIKGSLDLNSRLAEKRAAYRATSPAIAPEVRVHPRSSADGTGVAIDIRASDRVGLLHDIAAGLADLGLEVELAKIDTRGTEAIDIFEAKNPKNHSLETIAATLKRAVASP